VSTPLPAGFRLGVIAPQDAIEAFRRRNLVSPSFSWQDVWQAEHANRFTVAKLARTDLLEAIRGELDRAISEGRSLDQFAAEIQPRLARAGWWGTREVIDPSTGQVGRTTFNPARLQLIFDVNLRQSYAAGRWQRIQRNKSILPFIVYRTMRDERVRASHRPWHGLALPVDDPFWQTHYPPNGWRCRCTAYAIDEQGLAELQGDGFQIKRERPPLAMQTFVNRRTGEVSRVPRGVDPGFAYNPGIAMTQATAAAAADKLATWSPRVSAAAVRELVGSRLFAQYLAQPQGADFAVGLLDSAAARRLRSPARVVRLTAQGVETGADLAAADYGWVQDAIERGRSVVDGTRSLLYVLDEGGVVTAARVTRMGRRLELSGLRRLPRAQALQDPRLGPLLERA
jgi:SPP1 gp7 family putative phage head morphogenesis protein